MKIVEMDASADLSAKALEEAVARIAQEIHDGWADLVVHQAQLGRGLKLVGAHNATARGIRLRLLCSNVIGREDWTVKTKAVELRVHRATA